MEALLFLTLNLMMFGFYLQAKRGENEYPFVMYLLSGLMSLFIVAGLLTTGLGYCCNTSFIQLLPSLVRGLMQLMYFVLFLGLMYLGIVDLSDRGFK
jgi:hypothetical protein